MFAPGMGMGGMGMYGGMMPFMPGLRLGQAARYGAMKPNLAGQVRPPQAVAATAEGVAQVAPSSPQPQGNAAQPQAQNSGNGPPGAQVMSQGQQMAPGYGPKMAVTNAICSPEAIKRWLSARSQKLATDLLSGNREFSAAIMAELGFSQVELPYFSVSKRASNMPDSSPDMPMSPPATMGEMGLPTAALIGAVNPLTTVGGGALGAAKGWGRGNVPEGLGRGILRGGATGAGAMMGGVLGSRLAQGKSTLATILGMLAGGVGGHYLSGKALGEPVGGRKKDEEKIGLAKSAFCRTSFLKESANPMGLLRGLGRGVKSLFGFGGGAAAPALERAIPRAIPAEATANRFLSRIVQPGQQFPNAIPLGVDASRAALPVAQRAVPLYEHGRGMETMLRTFPPAGQPPAGARMGILEPQAAAARMAAPPALPQPALQHMQMPSMPGATPSVNLQSPNLHARLRLGAGMANVPEPEIAQRVYQHALQRGLDRHAAAALATRARGLATGQQMQGGGPISDVFNLPQAVAAMHARTAQRLARPYTPVPYQSPVVPKPPQESLWSRISEQGRPSGPVPMKTSYDLFAVLAKIAAQDNSKPQRSATGESQGLTFQHKPDIYAKGPDAWASVGSYLHSHNRIKDQPNPFIGRHAPTEKKSLYLFGVC